MIMSDIEMKAKFKQWFFTKAPNEFRGMFATTTEAEAVLLEICFHQFAEYVSNSLKKELEITNKLLEERQKLLDAIPECPTHGKCVPDALEWIEKMRAK